MRGGHEEKKPQKMVRSSIACARCRRSKVKCINTGVNSVCKACHLSSRECTYPPSGSASMPKRSEATAGIKQEDGEVKKRIRKTEDSVKAATTREEEALESPVLTKKVWDELYDIFKLHFSTEMPFFHPPTFRHRMRQASFPRDTSAPPIDIDGKVLLLGVLTLTARFHPELVAHHSQQAKPNDPLDASEHYATALKLAFSASGGCITSHSLDVIQSLLMLGLYEWGQTRGLSAWVWVGIAMRLAQSMGLAYEDDPDRGVFPPTLSRKASTNARDAATHKEVRRRTLWSCFIMDRMLAAGKCRPTMIATDKLRVKLPCSDDQFLFVHDVPTGFLNSDWLEGVSATQADDSINDDGVLSRYIRLVEIFGRFSEWSYAGGRRIEKLPPWDKSTEFFKLSEELENFHASLPSSLTFTEANLSAHLEKRNATTYASLHTLYSLCLIMLHREYIPFIPLRCEKPQGPLDEPTFPSQTFEIPEGFWEDSAEKIFKAARDIVDIVRTCQDNNALPESPQIGFAVWQAAFVCVYAVHFKHMDTGRYLTQSQDSGLTNDEFRTKGYAGLTVKILGEMVPRLRMAKGYLKTIGKMHDYFQCVKNDYCDRFKRKPLGWVGGGLEQYKMLERELKEFGSLEDSDKIIASDGSDTVDPARSRASTNEIGQGSVNGEPMQGVEAAPTPRPNGAWAPINVTSPPVEVDDRPKYNQSQPYPYNVSYQQSPGQSSNPPSLVSPGNGDSTPGINSPYAQSQTYHNSSPAQQIAAYPSMAQHTQAQIPMAPPGTQGGMHPQTAAKNEEWMVYQEGIRMNSGGFDNYAQVYPTETWAAFSEYTPSATPSYMEVLYQPTSMG